ncbi:hypothetical protein [Streptomyces inusitatus]|uniref:hypothetical protein n=1 Tax=Streptomyces inusitatus TaxID=68221 RepID=UPI00167E0E32|nr:hypothetical protein [Streptomyces inusitatus]
MTFDVTRWFKPAAGQRRLELDVADPAIARVDEEWRPGRHALLMIPARPELSVEITPESDMWRMLDEIDGYAADAAATECPAYWRDREPDPLLVDPPGAAVSG